MTETTNWTSLQVSDRWSVFRSNTTFRPENKFHQPIRFACSLRQLSWTFQCLDYQTKRPEIN